MHVTKRSLGVNYIAGIGLVLSGILLAQLLVTPQSGVPVWAITGFGPALALGSTLYWLPRIDLDDDQVWRVAECGALGLELTTLVVVGLLWLSVSVTEATSAQVAIIANTLATGTVLGVLGGAVWEIHNTNERMAVRTEVLNRVLRHNLRNDMTVVFGQLEQVRANVDEPQQSRIDTTLEKLDGLLEMTEQVRAVDAALGRGSQTHRPVDVVDCIDCRVEEITTAQPAVTIHTDCPAEAWAHADDMLGTLLDNIVGSAVDHGDGDPTLYVHVTTSAQWVDISIEDADHTLPVQDLAVVSSGRETKLDHGCGIELWLVDWLVEKYDGQLTIESADDGLSLIDIRLPRADGRSRLGL
ncbi:sensor histidine kinase [Halorientalis salina]|uniref:sensor histidine kinase n=1 Tax=Halorientalis salina TaxID=2932266 RepID=UPI0010AC7303|nr:HAMP domain-containing sensor histidine kinase [Halorientalis salina]